MSNINSIFMIPKKSFVASNNINRTQKIRNQIIDNMECITVPGPSVHGPPTKATILAPVPGKQAPSKPVATLRATPVQRDGRVRGATGH